MKTQPHLTKREKIYRKILRILIICASITFCVGLFLGILTGWAIFHTNPINDTLQTADDTNDAAVVQTVPSVSHTVFVNEPAVVPMTDSVAGTELLHEPEIDPEELYLLAHLIYAEAGSDWCSDKMQMYVGSVVLNRMAYWWYPDTMYDVIYQKGQYACTWDGNFEKEPNQRAWDMAKYLLINGSQLPSNVIFQAEFKQGDGVYEKVQNMYFCYKNE